MQNGLSMYFYNSIFLHSRGKLSLFVAQFYGGFHWKLTALLDHIGQVAERFGGCAGCHGQIRRSGRALPAVLRSPEANPRPAASGAPSSSRVPGGRVDHRRIRRTMVNAHFRTSGYGRPRNR